MYILSSEYIGQCTHLTQDIREYLVQRTIVIYFSPKYNAKYILHSVCRLNSEPWIFDST